MTARDGQTEPRVLDVCEALHMFATGGCDMPPAEAERMYRWLSARLANWKLSASAQTALYDALVRALALQALDDYRGSLRAVPLVPPVATQLPGPGDGAA